MLFLHVEVKPLKYFLQHIDTNVALVCFLNKMNIYTTVFYIYTYKYMFV